MAMKLFAHVLRSEIVAAESNDPADMATADSRRWVFRDLLVRRHGYAAWGLWQPTPVGAATAPVDPALEPHWADTQPWCHD